MADPTGPGSYSSKKVRQPNKIKGGLPAFEPPCHGPGPLWEGFWAEAGLSLDLEAPWNVNGKPISMSCLGRLCTP